MLQTVLDQLIYANQQSDIMLEMVAEKKTELKKVEKERDEVAGKVTSAKEADKLRQQETMTSWRLAWSQVRLVQLAMLCRSYACC